MKSKDFLFSLLKAINPALSYTHYKATVHKHICDHKVLLEEAETETKKWFKMVRRNFSQTKVK
jgi:hypothetical protein